MLSAYNPEIHYMDALLAHSTINIYATIVYLVSQNTSKAYNIKTFTKRITPNWTLFWSTWYGLARESDEWHDFLNKLQSIFAVWILESCIHTLLSVSCVNDCLGYFHHSRISFEHCIDSVWQLCVHINLIFTEARKIGYFSKTQHNINIIILLTKDMSFLLYI